MLLITCVAVKRGEYAPTDNELSKLTVIISKSWSYLTTRAQKTFESPNEVVETASANVPRRSIGFLPI